MASREWIGEYWLITEEYQTYKDKWVEKHVSLGKCLSLDEARDKAVIALQRDFPNSQIRDTYILDGWSHLTYM